MQYCYFGHHKCATTWFTNVIAAVCQDVGLSWATMHGPEGPAASIDFPIFRNSVRTNRPSRDFLGFHVIRDPRDLVVSAYFSHLKSHPTDVWPELVKIRAELSQMNEEQGLLWELRFLEPTMTSLATWDYSDNRVLEVKMEDFIKDPFSVCLSIFRHLKLLDEKSFSSVDRLLFQMLAAGNKIRRPVGPHGRKGWIPRQRIPAERLLGIVFTHRFEKLGGGRARGTEDVNSHFRKGVAGDWKEHFTPAVKDSFKERYQSLLVARGYESSSDW